MRPLRSTSRLVALALFACAACATSTPAVTTPPAADSSRPVARTQPGRTQVQACAAVGCTSGVKVVAHLDASRAQLFAAGAFTVCHGKRCASGTFGRPIPGRSPAVFGCVLQQPSSPLGFRWCDVDPEGSGVTMRFTLIRDDDTYRDGDRFALRVTLDGKPVLDHVRSIGKYENQYPNGPDCGGACVSSDVEIWPDSPNSGSCDSARCEPYVRFERRVPMTEATSGMTELTACYNGACRTGRVELWRWRDGHAVAWGAGSSAVGEGADRFGPIIDIRPDGQGGYFLRVSFRGDLRRFQRGDRFSVEWHARETGAEIMKGERTVSHYDESYPGGRACTPVACRQKTFTL